MFSASSPRKCGNKAIFFIKSFVGINYIYGKMLRDVYNVCRNKSNSFINKVCGYVAGYGTVRDS